MTEAEAIVIVQDEATKRGITFTDGVAGLLLWEETGWPSFFMTNDTERHIREQIGAALDKPTVPA